jgi:pentatricopeptide repeat protein
LRDANSFPLPAVPSFEVDRTGATNAAAPADPRAGAGTSFRALLLQGRIAKAAQRNDVSTALQARAEARETGAVLDLPALLTLLRLYAANAAALPAGGRANPAAAASATATTSAAASAARGPPTGQAAALPAPRGWGEGYDARRLSLESSLVFDDILAAGHRPVPLEAFNLMAKMLAPVGNPDKALKLAQSLHEHGHTPPPQFDALIATALARGGRIDLASPLFDRIKDANFKPLRSAYSALVLAYALKHRLNEAFQVVRDMAANNCKPSQHVCRALMEISIERSASEHVDHALQLLVSQHGALDRGTCMAALNVAGVTGNIALGVRVWNILSSFKGPPSAEAYSAMIYTFGIGRDDASMCAALVEMAQHHPVPFGTIQVEMEQPPAWGSQLKLVEACQSPCTFRS